MAKRPDWPFLRAKCLLCSHENCPECREISTSILACCKCRAEAIKRLEDRHECQDENSGDNG